MLNDPLAAVLAKIMNAERSRKKEVWVKPASKIIRKIISLMNEHGYVGLFEEFPDDKGGSLKLNLLGNINQCGVVKPRFSTKHDGFEKWEKRYLPARGFGLILVSTPLGIMSHHQAKEKNQGGRLVAYVY